MQFLPQLRYPPWRPQARLDRLLEPQHILDPPLTPPWNPPEAPPLPEHHYFAHDSSDPRNPPQPLLPLVAGFGRIPGLPAKARRVCPAGFHLFKVCSSVYVCVVYQASLGPAVGSPLG